MLVAAVAMAAAQVVCSSVSGGSRAMNPSLPTSKPARQCAFGVHLLYNCKTLSICKQM
jgi:hypothetical protein